jgi:hypothetical protein
VKTFSQTLGLPLDPEVDFQLFFPLASHGYRTTLLTYIYEQAMHKKTNKQTKQTNINIKRDTDSFSKTLCAKKTLLSRVARWYIFKPKIPIWVNFGGSWSEKGWYILLPFGIFYSHLVLLRGIW